MHGAGLSHVLFLPRQTHRVALVEVFNTHDEFCFKVAAAGDQPSAPVAHAMHGCVRIWPS